MQGRPSLSNRFRVYRERSEIPTCMQMDRSRLADVMTDLLANRTDAAAMREVLNRQFSEPSIDVEAPPRMIEVAPHEPLAIKQEMKQEQEYHR